MAQISVVIVESTPSVRADVAGALQRQPDIEVIGCGARPRDVARMARLAGPGVVVIVRPSTPGGAASDARRVRGHAPNAHVIGLGRPGEDGDASDVLRAGADGYVATRDGPDALVPAVRAVARGDAYLCPAAATALVARWRDCGPDLPPPVEEAGLSPRELEVLASLVAGRSNLGIAADLGISANTVKHHVAAVMAKLGAENRAAAVAMAMRRGLVPATVG